MIRKLANRINILGFWKGNNYDRLLLFSLILGTWALIIALEEFLPEKILDNLPSNVSLSLLSILGVLVILHTIYIFIAQFHRRRNPKSLDDSYLPSIDIFISAHNEEAVIGETLEHFVNHDYPKLKVYIINDRSEDRTLEICQSFEAKYSDKLKIIDRAKDAFPGKAAALNDALGISSGEVICVFDADARVKPGFLKSIVRHLANPLVGGAQAQKVISNPERNFLTKCQFHEYALDTYLQKGRDSIRGSVELRGNGELIKRIALEHVGGWNEDTLTDDLDLSTCLHAHGWDIRFSYEDEVYEEGVPTFKGLIKQRRRWAEGSMRRYLNYLTQIFNPGVLTINQIFDTFVYLGQFFVPLWIFLDICYELIRLSQGRETYLSFLMLVSIPWSFFMFFTQFNGLRIYKNYGFFKALCNTIISNAYVWSTWLFIIIVTYRKILFSRSVGTWTRTEHGV